MNLINSLQTYLSGNSFSNEFLCVADKGGQPEVRIEIFFSSNATGIDITGKHIFLGAGPVFIGINHPGIKDFSFQTAIVKFAFKQHLLGTMQIKRLALNQKWPAELLLFEGVNAKSYLLLPFKRLLQYMMYLQRRSRGHAFLSWQVNEMIRIMYAVPRKISVISVAGDNKMNLFPCDLNGTINRSNYAMALRAGGRALEQVKTYKKIAVCNMAPQFNKEVLELGKNHMCEMRTRENFRLSKIRTQNFQIPIPMGATTYKELELVETTPLGFYELLLFKIVKEQILEEGLYLSMVHNAYASWRKRKGLSFEYLE